MVTARWDAMRPRRGRKYRPRLLHGGTLKHAAQKPVTEEQIAQLHSHEMATMDEAAETESGLWVPGPERGVGRGCRWERGEAPLLDRGSVTGRGPEDTDSPPRTGRARAACPRQPPRVVAWHGTGGPEVRVLGGGEPRVLGNHQRAELSGPPAVRKGSWPTGVGQSSPTTPDRGKHGRVGGSGLGAALTFSMLRAFI